MADLTLLETTPHSMACPCGTSARVRIAHEHPVVAGMRMCAGCGFPGPDTTQGEAPIPRGYVAVIWIGRFLGACISLFTLAPKRIRNRWLRAQVIYFKARTYLINWRRVRATKRVAVLERQLNAARTPNPYPNEPPTLH